VCEVEIRLGLKTEFGVNHFVNKLKEQKVDISGKCSCKLLENKELNMALRAKEQGDGAPLPAF